MIDQSYIKEKLINIYKKIDTEREPVCCGCGRGGIPLSHSHIISRKRCKEIGKPELIYDEDNIELECFFDNRSCHHVWEHGTLAEKKKMINFAKKMEYVKKNDPEKLYKYK